MSQTELDPKPSPQAPPAGDDPLAHLHKMSTTAGLGSGDYVAVNGTAVFALILGLFSFLAFFSEMLLIVPLACLVTSIVAIRQINRSYGTQTGRWIVVIGLLAALACGGFTVVRWATEGVRTREDRQAFAQLTQDLANKLKANDYAGVYNQFSDRYHQRLPQEAFVNRLKLLLDYYGPLQSIAWNGLADFDQDETTGDRYAAIALEFNFQKGQNKSQLRDTARLRKEGDKWMIEAMPDLFPIPAPPKH
jgi:hypothetical protein